MDNIATESGWLSYCHARSVPPSSEEIICMISVPDGYGSIGRNSCLTEYAALLVPAVDFPEAGLEGAEVENAAILVSECLL